MEEKKHSLAPVLASMCLLIGASQNCGPVTQSDRILLTVLLCVGCLAATVALVVQWRRGDGWNELLPMSLAVILLAAAALIAVMKF